MSDEPMDDLCQTCKKFKDCPYGDGGDKIDPVVKQREGIWGLGIWSVVECDLKS